MAAGPSVALSEAWPELVLSAEKDLRDLIPFLIPFLSFFFTVEHSRHRLEMSKREDEDS